LTSLCDHAPVFLFHSCIGRASTRSASGITEAQILSRSRSTHRQRISRLPSLTILRQYSLLRFIFEYYPFNRWILPLCQPSHSNCSSCSNFSQTRESRRNSLPPPHSLSFHDFSRSHSFRSFLRLSFLSMLIERRFPLAGQVFFCFPPQTPSRADVPLPTSWRRHESYISI
jgi:hypothetical protein